MTSAHDENNTTPSRPVSGFTSARRKVSRFTSNLFDGADGSIIWLVKWCAEQLKIAAEALNNQLSAAQNDFEQRAQRRRDNENGDQ